MPAKERSGQRTEAEPPARRTFTGIRGRRTLRHEVLERLSAAIVTGELPEDTMVTVPTLAEEFAVSATPVREALLELEQRGFVVAVKNKGYRVTTIQQHDLAEIVQVRRMLEVPAIRIAATDFPPERAAGLHALAEAIMARVEAGDLAGYLQADWAFHRALLELTGNQRLVDLVGELRHHTRMVGLAGMKGTPELRRSSEEHGRLVDLLVAGDADGAAALLHDHIGHVLGWWSGRPEQA